MRTPAQIFLIFLIATLSTSSYAMKEFPFCPSGGPQGWLNYFEYKRDQNRWQKYMQYQQNRSYIPENTLPAYGENYGYNSYPGSYPGYGAIHTPQSFQRYNSAEQNKSYSYPQQ